MSIIKLIHGSCADQNVDAIVNAANRNLLAGSGICGAIFSKAGYEELTKACNEIETPLKDGEAAITPSFNITNARKIIHAVGPNFAINPDAFDKLFLAYYNSMKLLKDSFLHTIAFPLISSGIFGGTGFDSRKREERGNVKNQKSVCWWKTVECYRGTEE